MLNVDEDEEHVRVYLEDLFLHPQHPSWTLGLVWQRFIPGRPNTMRMKVVADKWEQSEAAFRGARIHKKLDSVTVNVYTENYPKVLAANVLDMVPNKCYRVGDLKHDLPDGIELHPKYERSLDLPIFKFEKTMRTVIYDSILDHSLDPIDLYRLTEAKM
jgi:hypothetical protein